MKTTNASKLKIGILGILAALLLNACGAANQEPTPTPFSVEAVYTAAAETLSVQLTEAALSMPTATMTFTASPTNTAMPTETFQLGPTSTTGFILVSTQIPLATITPGPSPTPTGSATSQTLGCHNAGFISHISVPDNTVMQPGESFTKIWEIKNTGTGECAWTSDYRLVFVGGNILGSDSSRIGQRVGTGAIVRVRLNMVAPTAPGTYTSQWRMATPERQPFGVVFSVTIKVPGPTHTATSPVTNTPIPPTNTPTNTPTETPTP